MRMPSDRKKELVIELAGGWDVNVVGRVDVGAKAANNARDDCGERISVKQ
jgi:hypothetical protein